MNGQYGLVRRNSYALNDFWTGGWSLLEQIGLVPSDSKNGLSPEQLTFARQMGMSSEEYAIKLSALEEREREAKELALLPPETYGLTPEQLEFAKQQGVTAKEYAARLLKLEERAKAAVAITLPPETYGLSQEDIEIAQEMEIPLKEYATEKAEEAAELGLTKEEIEHADWLKISLEDYAAGKKAEIAEQAAKMKLLPSVIAPKVEDKGAMAAIKKYWWIGALGALGIGGGIIGYKALRRR